MCSTATVMLNKTPPGDGGQNLSLQNAIKSVIGQMFRLNVHHEFEMCIEGTVGVTVDRHSLHFDDTIDTSHHRDTFISNCLGLETSENLLSPFSVSNSVTLSADMNYNPIEADPQFEVVVESAPNNLVESNHLINMQDSSKTMGCNDDVAINNKFDSIVNENIVLDSEDDRMSPLSLASQEKEKVNKNFKTRGKVFRGCSDLPGKLSDSKESVFRKIKKLKKKASTRMFVREPPELPLDNLDVESNFSSFSFDRYLDDVDSKADLYLGRKNEKQIASKIGGCEVCGMKLKSISQLEAHLVSKHGVTDSTSLGKITNFSCSICRKKYRFQAQLVKHSLRHELKKPFRCNICKNSYRCKESLKLHRQVHDWKNNSDILTCDICMKSYDNRILFQKHISYMHEKIKDNNV